VPKRLLRLAARQLTHRLDGGKSRAAISPE